MSNDSAMPDQSTSMGLDANIAGLLAYLLGWLSGLVIFLMEKRHGEVRYHAAQSLVVALALTALSIVMGAIAMVPVLGWIVALVGYLVLGVGGFALWIYLMIKGYKLEHVRLPWAGDLAERLVANN